MNARPGSPPSALAGGTKDIPGITREQIRRFADKASRTVDPLCRVVLETVDTTAEAWRRHDAKAMLPDDIRASLDRHLTGVAGRTQG